MTTTEKYIRPTRVCPDDAFIIEDRDGKEALLVIEHDDSPAFSPRDWDNVGTMVCWHRRYNLGDKHDYSEPKDFLRDLAETADRDELLEYVKNGEASEMKLGYNEDSQEWELDTRWDFNGEWYTSTHEDMHTLEDEILQEMAHDDLLLFASKNHVILPLYLYDHSGITMSTGSFSCPWDSGQVGWIYVSKEKVFGEGLRYMEPELMATRDPKIFNDAKNWECPTEENWKKIAAHFLEGEVETYDDYITGAMLGYQVYDIGEDGEIDNDSTDSCWGFYGYETARNGILDGFNVLREVEIEKEIHSYTTIRVA